MIDLSAAASTGAVIRSAIGCRWFDVVRLGPVLDMGITSHTEVRSRRWRMRGVDVTAAAIARAHGAIWQPFCGVVVFRLAHDGIGAMVGLSAAQRDALLSGAVFASTVHH
ncbi:hypothetical protein [Rhodococcus sp. ACS1]|uniref:hypothetical protein n=1 Tax=Rhodococcus sp. ACS1 TaxID=2028570 RepID=UPI00211CDBEC|nr:hypothetical protein [Rhodococcus sp. ACS1]